MSHDLICNRKTNYEIFRYHADFSLIIERKTQF